MLGLAIVAMGGVLLWAAMTGRAQAVIQSLGISLPSATANITATPSTTKGVNQPAGSSSSGGGTPFNPASSAAYLPGPGGLGGSFQGQSGASYTGSYASLTPAQRDDVNAYANHTSNTSA